MDDGATSLSKDLTESLLAKIQNHYCGRNITNLAIIHEGNFIILSGKTSSYHLKQVVQELVSKEVFAVNLALHNRIAVEYKTARNPE